MGVCNSEEDTVVERDPNVDDTAVAEDDTAAASESAELAAPPERLSATATAQQAAAQKKFDRAFAEQPFKKIHENTARIQEQMLQGADSIEFIDESSVEVFRGIGDDSALATSMQQSEQESETSSKTIKQLNAITVTTEGKRLTRSITGASGPDGCCASQCEEVEAKQPVIEGWMERTYKLEKSLAIKADGTCTVELATCLSSAETVVIKIFNK